jgi:hypothetical protein
LACNGWSIQNAFVCFERNHLVAAPIKHKRVFSIGSETAFQVSTTRQGSFSNAQRQGIDHSFVKGPGSTPKARNPGKKK